MSRYIEIIEKQAYFLCFFKLLTKIRYFSIDNWLGQDPLCFCLLGQSAAAATLGGRMGSCCGTRGDIFGISMIKGLPAGEMWVNLIGWADSCRARNNAKRITFEFECIRCVFEVAGVSKGGHHFPKWADFPIENSNKK